MPIDVTTLTLRERIALKTQLGAKLSVEDYKLMDWTKSNSELAKEYGVPTGDLSHFRTRFGHPKVTKFYPACKNWDWSKTDIEISRETGATVGCIRRWRYKLHAPAAQPTVRTSAYPKHLLRQHASFYESLDWENKSDQTIAKELGLTREYIRQKRAQLGKPKAYHWDLRIKRFKAWLGDRTSVEFKDVPPEFNLAHSGFVKIMTRLGLWEKKHHRIHPWHLFNWELPNQILGRIWGVTHGVVSGWRSNHRLPKPRFFSRLCEVPSYFQPLVTAEEEKAKVWREQKQNQQQKETNAGLPKGMQPDP